MSDTTNEQGWKMVSSLAAEPERGPQGQLLIPGVNTKLAGSKQLSAGLVVMPPGGVSKFHMHKDNELICFLTEGWAASLVGPELTSIVHGPGDFVFIREGLEHIAVNLSTEKQIVAIECRADPAFNDDVQLVPIDDEKVMAAVNKLRQEFAAGTLTAGRANDRQFTFEYPEGVPNV